MRQIWLYLKLCHILYLPCMNKSLVYTLFKAHGANSFPHQPQLQTVHLAAALHRLIPNVQVHIVELILLEEVCGIGTVALLQQILEQSQWLSKNVQTQTLWLLILQPLNCEAKPWCPSGVKQNTAGQPPASCGDSMLLNLLLLYTETNSNQHHSLTLYLHSRTSSCTF